VCRPVSSLLSLRCVGRLAIAAVVLLCGVSLVGRSADAGATAAPRFSTNGLWITDAQGRDLFLRGVDVTGAEDEPTADALPYGPADFLRMRAAGVTVVRLPIAWAMIEPTPGHFDQTAIARAVQIVEWAGAAGLLVVLDMHQYLWTPCFGGNGVPTWAVPNCPATPPDNVAQQEADILVAQNAFWHSATLQGAFTQAWLRVARAVGHPWFLLGYDILNEPGPGFIPNEVFEEQYLAPFYRSVGSQLRTVDPGALLFIEPSVLNGLVNGTSQFLLPIGLARLVYEPHQYGAVSLNADATVGVADVGGPEQFAPDLTLNLAIARRIGSAIWLGEWGAINPAVSVAPTSYVRDDMAEQDRFMLGSAYWSYDSSLRGPNVALGAQLTRIVPLAIAGTPESISTGTSAMSLAWRSDGGQTLISFPATCVPEVAATPRTASTALLRGDYVAVTAPTGVVSTVQVTCH
jgi:cellulase (glycosyl hydrolase family 5)